MTQKLHTSALNVLITLFAFSSFTAVFADSLYVLLYCTVHEFHLHYKALPFSLLVSFIVLVLNISSLVPNLFFNFFGAKKERKCMQKKIGKKDFGRLIKDFLQHRIETGAHYGQTGVGRFLSQFANYCPLLKTVDFLEDIFAFFHIAF